MLTNSNTTEMKSFLNKYDFYFFPIVNPDGKQPYILRIHSHGFF